MKTLCFFISMHFYIYLHKCLLLVNPNSILKWFIFKRSFVFKQEKCILVFWMSMTFISLGIFSFLRIIEYSECCLKASMDSMCCEGCYCNFVYTIQLFYEDDPKAVNSIQCLVILCLKYFALQLVFHTFTKHPLSVDFLL